MRIAQMLDTLHMGGAQKMQIFLAQELHPLGIDVTVINLRLPYNPAVVTALENAGAHVVTFPFQRLVSARSFQHLVGFLRKEKFALLHTYLTYSNIVGSFAGLLSRTPVIASLRSASFDKDRVPRSRILLENFALRYVANRVTANGYSVAQFAKDRLKNTPIDIIINAVDDFSLATANEREQIRLELTGNPDRPIIFSAGRLSKPKGFLDLLEAFCILHMKYPTASLVIAGEGSREVELADKVNDLELQDYVFFIGFRDDVRRIMSAVDIYVNSSYWEGTPVSVLEAMAAGLPIVATNVGENPYLLDSNCAILVPPKQPQKMAEALGSLLDSPEKRIAFGQVVRKRVQENYGPDAWRNSILNLYSQVTPKAKPFLGGAAQKVEEQ